MARPQLYFLVVFTFLFGSFLFVTEKGYATQPKAGGLFACDAAAMTEVTDVFRGAWVILQT